MSRFKKNNSQLNKSIKCNRFHVPAHPTGTNTKLSIPSLPNSNFPSIAIILYVTQMKTRLLIYNICLHSATNVFYYFKKLCYCS